jgi:hypothetical protein
MRYQHDKARQSVLVHCARRDEAFVWLPCPIGFRASERGFSRANANGRLAITWVFVPTIIQLGIYICRHRHHQHIIIAIVVVATSIIPIGRLLMLPTIPWFHDDRVHVPTI